MTEKTEKIPAKIQLAVKEGHRLENDPTHALSQVQRWTCRDCGDAVLDAGTVIYGGATKRTCKESHVFWGKTSESPGCKECGAPTWTTQRYRENAFEEKLKDYCFPCAFWMERLGETENPRQLVALSHTGSGDIHCYCIDAEMPVAWDVNRSFLGFGGAWWEIVFASGSTQYVNNLWSRGDVPDRFRERFQVLINAELRMLRREDVYELLKSGTIEQP